MGGGDRKPRQGSYIEFGLVSVGCVDINLIPIDSSRGSLNSHVPPTVPTV